jgi:hypothetical protein
MYTERNEPHTSPLYANDTTDAVHSKSSPDTVFSIKLCEIVFKVIILGTAAAYTNIYSRNS